MKKNLLLLLTLGLSIPCGLGLIAQGNAEQVSEKMEKLAWIQGSWQGEAWYIGPDRAKHVIQQQEQMDFKLAGAILTAEGTGTRKNEETQEMETVFRAFGIFTWDLNSSTYVLRAYRDGNFIDSELVPNKDGSFSWFIDLPYGKTRYTLRQTEDGNYNEKGEFSRDGGETWMQNFEMTLKKE